MTHLDNLGVKNTNITINNLLYLFTVSLINMTITVKQNHKTICKELTLQFIALLQSYKRNLVKRLSSTWLLLQSM